MRIEEGFQPVPFEEGNPYATDPALPSLLKRILPRDVFRHVDEDLERFGGEVLTTLRETSKLSTPPQLIQYDNWGRRVDELRTSEGWRRMKDIFHREGLVSIAYERKYGEHSRPYGFAKLFLATADSDVTDCPMSMTDGVARVIELIGSETLKRDVLARLTSRDPAAAYTAGQWMTERPGGSDVSRTETVAAPDTASQHDEYGPRYKLDGFKWFSSATDSDVALALARTGRPEDGSRGLSLFLVPVRLPLVRDPGAPRPSAVTNNIFIHRLKNKFGTKIVPTAELSINGAQAFLLGEPNQGVKLITPVLNITRTHSAVGSVGYLRKCLAIATAYSSVRKIRSGTQLLKDTPLHVAELAKLHVLYRALLQLTFGSIVLLGKAECGVASESEGLRLRLLTPAIKAFTAEKCVTAMEECMACLGGEGYMEENGIAKLIPDGIVEKIWEGTITVLSLDLVRAAEKSTAMDAFVKWAHEVLQSCSRSLSEPLGGPLAFLRLAVDELANAYKGPIHPLLPRPALFLFCHVASSLYLLEQAIWAVNEGEPEAQNDVEVFRRWVLEGGLDTALENVRRTKKLQKDRVQSDVAIVYGSGGGRTAAKL
ncbi:acyl-CoA dehydrogenase/oxidase [Dichomitus squalens]|uniref:Acyl-CoA dehydrogenase/oxidase n=1 Tax=Dichomitus squalens TaxID=114155 RepID=A0A4Q9Q4T8_9APHY|nr:acyl-CoA dehydrogenase/oxidase [Dichomitus squalens]